MKQAADPFEAVKPLIVLGLLGMILYGAFSVIRRGPAGSASADLPGLSPPSVTMVPAAPTPSSSPAAAPVHPQPAAAVAGPVDPAPVRPADPELPPLVLKAFSSAPPVDEAVAPPATPAPAAAATPVVAAPVVAAPVVDPPQAGSQSPLPSNADRQSAAFAAAWADAHEKLASARYAEALAILSAWHDDSSLGPEETDRLEKLLGQLAGTVIYSQEDHVLPPHIVAPGENLRDIAAGFGVPWQLLANINGVPGPARLVPGEPLKVVAGPFDAVISLSRRRLSLQLKRNYAGSYAVVLGRQVQEHVGASLVVQRIRRGTRPSAAAPVSTTAIVQADHEQLQSAPKQILIAGGLVIEAADDPSAVADSAAGTSLVVSSRDLDELIDILGEGSRVFVRP